MSTARDYALQLSVIGAVKKYVGDLETKVKAEAKDAFRPGDRLTATTEDGTVVGTVSMTKAGDGSWAVTDPAAFLAWVKKNRPTAIVESVRSSDQTSILNGIESNGLVPDGVELKPGSKPTISVRPAHEVIRGLDWRRYLELEAAPATTPVAEPPVVEIFEDVILTVEWEHPTVIPSTIYRTNGHIHSPSGVCLKDRSGRCTAPSFSRPTGS